MLHLKPSFCRKLNPDGFTPLHLALREGNINTVKWLLKYNPELVCVRGKGGITPLHYVAERGDDDHVHHLAEFLVACPASIKHLTVRGETAVHLAVRNGRLRALKVLYGWLYRTDNEWVLNYQDIDGNTPLHLAVSTNQPEASYFRQMVKLLIRRDRKNGKNLQDKTALDIAMEFPEEENRQVRKILKKHSVATGSSLDTSLKMADFLSSHPRRFWEFMIGFDVYLDKGLSGDMRNALLVVAVLIATATYQAMLQPPSFVKTDNPSSRILTNATFATNTTIPFTYQWDQAGDHWRKFRTEESICFESIAFVTSLGMIWGLMPVNKYTHLLFISLYFLLASYVIVGSAIALPQVFIAFVLFLVVGVMRIVLEVGKIPGTGIGKFTKMIKAVVSCKYRKRIDK